MSDENHKIQKIRLKIEKILLQKLDENIIYEIDNQLQKEVSGISETSILEEIFAGVKFVDVLQLPYSPQFYWTLVFKLNSDIYYKQIVEIGIQFFNSKHWMQTFVLNCLFRIKDSKYTLSKIIENSQMIDNLSIHEITTFLEKDKTNTTFNNQHWISIYESFRGSNLSTASIPMIMDQKFLFHLAMNESHEHVSHLAIENIHDFKLLRKISFDAKSSTTRINAFVKISDNEEIAFEYAQVESEDRYRRLAFEKVNSLKKLRILVLIEKNDQLRQILKNRILDLEYI